MGRRYTEVVILTCQGFGVAGFRVFRLRGGDDNMLLQVVSGFS